MDDRWWLGGRGGAVTRRLPPFAQQQQQSHGRGPAVDCQRRNDLRLRSTARRAASASAASGSRSTTAASEAAPPSRWRSTRRARTARARAPRQRLGAGRRLPLPHRRRAGAGRARHRSHPRAERHQHAQGHFVLGQGRRQALRRQVPGARHRRLQLPPVRVRFHARLEAIQGGVRRPQADELGRAGAVERQAGQRDHVPELQRARRRGGEINFSLDDVAFF